MSSQLLSVQINSEQADYFDESVIDPLENPMSTRWTAVPPEAHQASVIRRPITVICSPLQLIAAGPDSQVPAPVQRYLLNINLKKGRNLVIRDKRSGRSKNSRWSESLRPWGDDYWLFISLHQTVLITVGIVLKQSRSRDTISGFMYTLKECGSFVFCFFFLCWLFRVSLLMKCCTYMYCSAKASCWSCCVLWANQRGEHRRRDMCCCV